MQRFSSFEARYDRYAVRARFIIGLCALFVPAMNAGAAIEIPVTIIGNYPAIPGFDVGYFIDNNIVTDYSSVNGGTSTYVDFQFPGTVRVGSAVYTDRTT